MVTLPFLKKNQVKDVSAKANGNSIIDLRGIQK